MPVEACVGGKEEVLQGEEICSVGPVVAAVEAEHWREIFWEEERVSSEVRRFSLCGLEGRGGGGVSVTF